MRRYFDASSIVSTCGKSSIVPSLNQKNEYKEIIYSLLIVANQISLENRDYCSGFGAIPHLVNAALSIPPASGELAEIPFSLISFSASQSA